MCHAYENTNTAKGGAYGLIEEQPIPLGTKGMRLYCHKKKHLPPLRPIAEPLFPPYFLLCPLFPHHPRCVMNSRNRQIREHHFESSPQAL